MLASGIIIKMAANMISNTGLAVFFTVIITIGISGTYAEVCPAALKKEWTYLRDHSNGPEHWGDKHPSCNAHLQSPINIVTSKVLKPDKPQILKLKNFDKPLTEVLIQNIGQLFTISPKDGIDRALIEDGHEYPFQSIHFHFGNITNDGGSEHTIDGKRFPMEAHFVFSFPGNKIIQVASFMEMNDEINPAVDNFLSVKASYKFEGGKFEGKIEKDNPDPRRQGKIHLDDMLDLNCPYYRYMGSGAVPPCPAGCPYIICKTHKYIKYSQLRRLFLIKSVTREEDNQHDCRMKNNNRPVQELSNRPVYG